MKHCYLLLADVFEISHNKCIKIYELDPAHFLSAPGLAWLVCLKKPEVESELLTDIDMLLMIEKDIRGGICHSIHRYARSKNKYIKNYNTDIELLYWGANSFYGWAMSQNYLQMVLNGKKIYLKSVKIVIWWR